MQTARPPDFVGSLRDRATALRALYGDMADRGLGQHERWHTIGTPGEAAFQPGYGSYGAPHAPVGFFRDPDGWVYLRGRLTWTSGQPEGLAFVLPPGYRPPQSAYFFVHYNRVVDESGGIHVSALEVAVHPDGGVIYHTDARAPMAFAPLDVPIDHVYFRTAGATA